MNRISDNFFCYGLLVAFMATLITCGTPLYDAALEPEDVLSSFLLDERFSIELFAAEPYVRDPVDMTIDAYGNVFVVEMPDYPFKPEPGEGRGRIRQLFDTDKDGRIDSASVFVDQISEITSILPWESGLLVAAAPYIYYMEDSDGSGRADVQEILFSGFFENNSEAQITNLKFGIDNWIYASNHGQRGTVRYHRDTTRALLNVAGGDFRFRLDRAQFEQETGPAQFGHAFNDRGHRFVTTNSHHIRQAVIPWRYLHRHPYLPSGPTVLNISDHEHEMFQETPPPYWRAERTRRRQAAFDEKGLDRVEYAEDHFTGCSGGTFYAGHTFPKEYYGNIFTGDVAGNLIHRDVLEISDRSPTYIAKRHPSELHSEFLQCTDSWFRPAHFYVAPDGFLYVVDFYRQHIETPLSIPEDLKEQMDFMKGSDRGRLYRIRPQDVEVAPGNGVNLESLSDEDLLDYLTHPNRWYRQQAQRLLLHHRPEHLQRQLQEMALNHTYAQARIHALYTLEGLDFLSEDLIMDALRDVSPGMREHALILAERFPKLQPHMVSALDDPDGRVAFQAVLSLGQFQNRTTIDALWDAMIQHGTNDWFRRAILSAPAAISMQFLDAANSDNGFLSSEAGVQFLEDFACATGHRNDEETVEGLLKKMTSAFSDNAKIAAAVSSGLIKGIRKSKREVVIKEEVLSTLESLSTWAELAGDLREPIL